MPNPFTSDAMFDMVVSDHRGRQLHIPLSHEQAKEITGEDLREWRPAAVIAGSHSKGRLSHIYIIGDEVRVWRILRGVPVRGVPDEAVA